MKLILLFLLLFAYTFVDASQYIRSIRLGSFSDKHAAEQTLKEAQKFLYSHKEMRDYQEKYHFTFKIIRSNNYYLVVLEPVTNKKVVQKLLDTLRLKYKSAYPKKLKTLPKETHIEKKVVSKPKPTPKQSPKIVSLPPQIEKPQKVIEKPQKVIEKNETIPQVQKPIEKKESFIEYISQKEFYIIALLLGVVIVFLGLWLLLVLRKNSQLRNKNEKMLFDLSSKTRKLQAREKMLSHVSHELRNPIASVLGLSQLILENDLPRFQKENVENIEHSAEKALEIIDDILNISKINAGELRIENREFNINSMIEHVLSNTYLQARHNNVDVILEIDEKIPAKIISDSLRLGQVLINLLSNAIKFSKNGTVQLKVSKKETRSQSIILEFSVIDDGIGMTQEQLERVFKSYEQADSSTSREFGGTGLGLSISKEFVEKMGGKIKVRSQKDVGTTFTFTIEAKIFDIDNKRHYHLPSKEYLNKSILIVENSNKNVIALLRAFRYFNYKTHVLPSLDSNVVQEDIKYDIIVINQTQVNEESIKKLQKMHFKNRAKTKIILTTYRFTKVDDEIIKQLDISGFLKIPFTQQNVLDTLIGMYGVKKFEESDDVNTVKNKLQKIDGKKILVAEDNVLNHKVLLGLLEKTGADVSFVTNGQEVVNLIKKGNKYDLILMDIEMPVINGYDATLEIRKEKANDGIPIIALSAKTDDAAKEKAFAVGMQGYLTKPISLDAFYKIVYDALSHSTKIHRDENIQTQESENELTALKELGKFEGEDTFYRSLLRDFQKMYANATDSFNTLIKNKQYKDAIVLVRDIKDVSLNIGAYKLCESAAGLEYDLEREEYSKILKSFQNFEAHMLRLLSEIDIYLEKK